MGRQTLLGVVDLSLLQTEEGPARTATGLLLLHAQVDQLDLEGVSRDRDLQGERDLEIDRGEGVVLGDPQQLRDEVLIEEEEGVTEVTGEVGGSALDDGVIGGAAVLPPLRVLPKTLLVCVLKTRRI